MAGWTPQQVNKAVNMWQDGKTATEIAHTISKTRNAVIGKLNRLGVKKQNTGSPQNNDDEVKAKKGSTSAGTKSANGRANQEIREDQKLTLLFLNEKTCRWPIGDPSTKNFWFCGKSPQPGKRYCAQHSDLAFQPNPVKKERSELQARVISRPYVMVKKK